MNKTLTAETISDANEGTAIDYKAAIADLFTQMEVIDERIKQNQSETEQLRSETRVMLAQMQAA